jgi:non-lysosomal glucosylceramidase
MRTLFSENFRESFHDHDLHGGRRFVEPGDQGLVMMSWPGGDRPANATKYADEVWSGQEYSSAALMIQRGLVDEGLRIVRAAFDRYDGRLRTEVDRHNCAALDGGGNPFGDDECGKWYARAMSNWSVLLALQGFSHDAAAQTIGFAPTWQPADHRTFFSAGDAWGTFDQKRDGPERQTDRLELKAGTLTIRRVELDTGDLAPAGVAVTLDGAPVGAQLERTGGKAAVVLSSAVVLEGGQTLEIELR